MLSSQKVRALAPEMDPLRMGMGWTREDLERPQVLVESTYGDSHPGSAHLNRLVEAAVRGARDGGAKPARYFATDICDGMAQGHDGINYSLAHRDLIAGMIEVHANATTFDAGVFVSSCDKAVPAQLMGVGRIDIPAVVVPGGVMAAGPDLLTLEDEDGKECTFEVIDVTEIDGTRYMAVVPYQEDPESLQEDAELILMRIGTDDDGEYMDIVDDDEELLRVGKVFEERLRAMFDIDDSELDGE